MARTPSLAPEVASSFRVSLTRIGEGAADAWRADVAGHPGCSARAGTPEEAVRRALGQVDVSVGANDDSRASEPRDTAETRRSGRLLVRMPATLHDELAHVAEREGVSLNQLITGALAAAVAWRTQEDTDADRATAAVGSANVRAETLRRRFGLALVANFLVVGIAAALAIALLVVAWQQG